MGVELYEPGDVRGALGACASGPSGYRDGALIFTLWCTGLRCGEVCALAPSDVKLEPGHVWVASGKGGKARTVVVPPGSREELRDRLSAWASIKSERTIDSDYLFCSLRGGRLDESYVRRMFRRIGRSAGLSCRFHPHGLRHTFAARMHLGGVPLEVIQRQLGHSDLSVTGAYLKRIGTEVVYSEMADFSLE